MRINLDGKTAVVTGAASGIGLAVAEALSEAGASVVIADLDEDKGNAAAAKIAASGRPCLFQPTDVRQSRDVQQLISFTQKRYGSLDILVNNAGLQHVAPIVEFPEEKWDLLVEIMLKGVFLCTKYAMPAMIERRWGRIINMSSIHGKVASAFKCAYVSSKFGICGLTKVTALEGAPYGVTANTVCPSYVRTPLVDKQIASQAAAHGISEEEVIEKIMLAKAPIKRLLEPAEVGQLVLFLCSESAAGITGTDISIDCGWTAL